MKTNKSIIYWLQTFNIIVVNIDTFLTRNKFFLFRQRNSAGLFLMKDFTAVFSPSSGFKWIPFDILFNFRQGMEIRWIFVRITDSSDRVVSSHQIWFFDRFRIFAELIITENSFRTVPYLLKIQLSRVWLLPLFVRSFRYL